MGIVLLTRLLIFIPYATFMVYIILATKYTYLYAKEQGYEHDWTPFFMFSAYRKYRCMAFKQEGEDTYYKKKCRLTNLYAFFAFTAVWVVSCILQLLGYA